VRRKVLLGKHGKRIRALPEMLEKGAASAAPMVDSAFWREMWETECRLRPTTERMAEERGRAKERERVATEEWVRKEREVPQVRLVR
jgi:hypothetical protein